jgi:hypothetical protein
VIGEAAIGASHDQHIYIYSGPSNAEHNPFEEAVRLSVCSTFELNVMGRTMLCNAALMVRFSNFYSSFKPNFSGNFFLVSSCSRNKPFDFRGSTVFVCVYVCMYTYM